MVGPKTRSNIRRQNYKDMREACYIWQKKQVLMQKHPCISKTYAAYKLEKETTCNPHHSLAL